MSKIKKPKTIGKAYQMTVTSKFLINYCKSNKKIRIKAISNGHYKAIKIHKFKVKIQVMIQQEIH